MVVVKRTRFILRAYIHKSFTYIPYLCEHVLGQVHLNEVCESVEGGSVDLLESAPRRRQTLQVDEAEAGELAVRKQRDRVARHVQRL